MNTAQAVRFACLVLQLMIIALALSLLSLGLLDGEGYYLVPGLGAVAALVGIRMEKWWLAWVGTPFLSYVVAAYAGAIGPRTRWVGFAIPLLNTLALQLLPRRASMPGAPRPVLR